MKARTNFMLHMQHKIGTSVPLAGRLGEGPPRVRRVSLLEAKELHLEFTVSVCIVLFDDGD
jgi:hypothetical protein